LKDVPESVKENKTKLKGYLTAGFGLFRWEMEATSFIFCIFGAVHCIAWNFIFPSDVELWLWRVGSLCTLVPVILPVIWFWVPVTLENWVLSVAVIGLYIPVRLYLFVEVFVGLRSVPVDVFRTVQWTEWIPHI
jgi:hypothetical protein